MRRTNTTTVIKTLGLVIATVFLFTQCKGPAGADANETCKQCHNSGTSNFTAQQYQYSASTHAVGGTSERAGSASCAVCHSHEGFIEFLELGVADSVSSISNPTQPACRTCHHIHENYDTTDYTLRVADAVELRATGDEVDFGKGNICASCHQPRALDVTPEEDGADITLTSSRFGVHHGPQSALVAGLVGVKFAGEDYGNNPHNAVEDGCVTCHMADAYGAQAGGHTFNVSYLYHGHSEVNTAGCVECHSDEDILADNVEALQEEVESLLDSLSGILIAEGILNPSSGLAVTDTAFSGNLVSAYLNYNVVEEDKSGGVHNPKYTKALLEGAIEKLSK